MKRQTLLTLLLFAFKSFKGTSPYQRSFVDLARLKASLMYVKSIETFRLLFMSILGVGICLILLATSLALFHTVLFVYTPWSAQVKLSVGLFFAVVYMAVAVKAFSYVFSESQWLKIFHAEEVVEDIASQTDHSGDVSTKRPYKESGLHN
jgi:hypothetical protein